MRKRATASQEADFVAGAKATAADKGATDKISRRPFNMLMPEELYNRLQRYMENCEERHGFSPNMSQLVIQGLTKRLDELEKKL